MQDNDEFDVLRSDYIAKTILYLDKLKEIQSKDFYRSNLASEMALLHADTTASYFVLIKMMIALTNQKV